jgi:hypothetical protein
MPKYLFLILLYFNTVSGQTQNNYFFSPGIKLGYAFGENGGFAFGFEGSYIVTGNYGDDPIYGVVLDYDWSGEIEKFHIGIEYIRHLAGVDLGPTIAWKDGNRYLGFSVIPFVGVLINPYYNYTFLNGEFDLQEVGAYVKVPIQIDDHGFTWYRLRRDQYEY